jgi:hypothetical protein
VAAMHGAFLSQCVDGSAVVPTSKVKEVAAMLKARHAQEDRAAARQKAGPVAAKLKEMKLADAAVLMLAAARLRHVAGSKWGTRRYLDMNRFARASEAA